MEETVCVVEPARFVTVNTVVEQLLEVEKKYGDSAYGEDTMCVGLARFGSEDQKIVSGMMKELESVDFGAPLHCLVIVGKTHPVAEELLRVLQIQNCKLNDHKTEEGSTLCS